MKLLTALVYWLNPMPYTHPCRLRLRQAQAGVKRLW